MAGQTRIARACKQEAIVRVSWARLANIAASVCAQGARLAGHARQPGLVAEVAGACVARVAEVAGAGGLLVAGAAACASQALQSVAEAAAVPGLRVLAGHATHADWFASSL